MKRPKYKDKESKQGDLNYGNLAREIINEINALRSDPQKYIEILEKDKTFFKENILYRPEENPLVTDEGEDAYNEAIEFLVSAEFRHELEREDHLCRACFEHCTDIGEHGLFRIEGSAHESIVDRLDKYAEFDNALCCSIEFGSQKAQEIVMSLLISDGDSSRKNRQNLFRGDFNYIGAACSHHEESEILTVICYAESVRELGTIPPDITKYVAAQVKNYEYDLSTKNQKVKEVNSEDADFPANGDSLLSTIKQTKDVEGISNDCIKKSYALTDGTIYIIEKYNGLKKPE